MDELAQQYGSQDRGSARLDHRPSAVQRNRESHSLLLDFSDSTLVPQMSTAATAGTKRKADQDAEAPAAKRARVEPAGGYLACWLACRYVGSLVLDLARIVRCFSCCQACRCSRSCCGDEEARHR